jgi:hypothetical protein
MHARTCSINKFTQNNDSTFRCSCFHYNHNDNNFLFNQLNENFTNKVIYKTRLYVNAVKMPLMDRYWKVIDKTMSEGTRFTISQREYKLYNNDMFVLLQAFRRKNEIFFYYPECVFERFPWNKLPLMFGTLVRARMNTLNFSIVYLSIGIITYFHSYILKTISRSSKKQVPSTI